MIKAIAIEGNCQWLDGGAMFGNAPRALWEKWVEVDDLNRIRLACRALYLEIDKKKYLFEVGIGAFFEPKLKERFGVESEEHLLLTNLKNHGINEDEIDFVVLSHLHFDHAGGLLPAYSDMQKMNGLHFPNAAYVVGMKSWERALNPHSRDRASFLPELNKRLQDSGRLFLIEGRSRPEGWSHRIEFLESYGHTPGQMHALIHGDEDSILFAGDLVPGMPWIHVPITMGYDRCSELLIDEKCTVVRRAKSEGWWVFLTHDANTAFCKVDVTDKQKYFGKDERSSDVTLQI